MKSPDSIKAQYSIKKNAKHLTSLDNTIATFVFQYIMQSLEVIAFFSVKLYLDGLQQKRTLCFNISVFSLQKNKIRP